MSDVSFSNIVGLAATTAVLCYTAIGEPIPKKDYFYKSEESLQQYLGQYDHSILNFDNTIWIAEKIIILDKFSKSILNNIKDIEPEYSAMVDENFWDLL